MPEALSPDAILDAAEGVLRRYGPAKASVLDVARALEVSHGSIYRHFASKAALWEAVTERWLGRIQVPLDAALVGGGPAVERLGRWLYALAASTQGLAHADPELFATLVEVARTSRVVAAHEDRLATQLTDLVQDGMNAGELAPGDPVTTARAVLHASARFHHPALAAEWSLPGQADDLDAVVGLLVRGLLIRR